MTTPAPSYLDHVAYRQRAGQGGTGVLFLHGYKSDMEGTKAVALDRWAQEWDAPYTRFDMRGHGLSHVDTDFNDLFLSDWLDDAARVLNELAQGPQILVGSSMGGWLALLLAKRYPDKVKHVIGVAAAPDFSKRIPEGRGTRVDGGYTFGDASFASDAFLADGDALCVLDGPLNLSCDVTLLQGRLDDVVPWQVAEAIKARCEDGQCVIHYVEDGDHRLNCDTGLGILRTSVEKLLT